MQVQVTQVLEGEREAMLHTELSLQHVDPS